MKFLEVIGLLLALGGIFLIDKPKLTATANKKKYSLVYCSVLAVCFLFGTLEMFSLLPTFNGMLVELYETLFGK